MSRHSRTGRRYRRIRADLLAADDTCWVCGHPGSNEVDHVVRLADGGDEHDPRNLRPAHGTRGCPVCGRKCNQERNRRRPRRERSEPSRRW